MQLLQASPFVREGLSYGLLDGFKRSLTSFFTALVQVRRLPIKFYHLIHHSKDRVLEIFHCEALLLLLGWRLESRAVFGTREQ